MKLIWVLFAVLLLLVYLGIRLCDKSGSKRSRWCIACNCRRWASYFWVLLLLGMCGCSKPQSKTVDYAASVETETDRIQAIRTAWEWHIATLGNAATVRMYGCITEIYSI